MTLIAGIIALLLLSLALNAFRAANPHVLARAIKIAGGIISLATATFLGVRGQIAVALPIGLFGLGLLGWVPFSAGDFFSRAARSSGQASRVRANFVEMTLDHDSGQLSGRFIAGRHAGRSLDEFDLPALLTALGEIDDDSRALLAGYLDRRFAGWREHAQGDAAGGRGRPPPGGKMTEEEAYQILGLQTGAGRADITRAHRNLMKKLHPDQGGSTYLAARVNEAKDVLLRRHRN
ncbi:MAG: molecular chaperone DnaJ [Xanthobacteraceae bacterium]|nr:MAG: molecular chaperone DnaJ [Xanthobacteraceae bacterium]